MKLALSVLIVFTLTVFAAASTAHAKAAVVMDVKMTMSVADGMDMDDCDGCGDAGDSKMACNTVCVTFLPAIVPPDAPLRSAPPELFDRISGESAVGQTLLPDPHPPRYLILS
jgi:hypothetical protein